MASQYYYQVIVAEAKFRGRDYLTYASRQPLMIGGIIRVPLQDNSSLAVVCRQVKKPEFPTKPIIETINLPPLPQTSLELMAWLADYYPAGSGIIGSLFLPKSLSNKLIKTGTTTPKTKPKAKLPKLTKEQELVVKRVFRNSAVRAKSEHRSAGVLKATTSSKAEDFVRNVHSRKTAPTPGSYLLHGETGSGKTRVYLELARSTIKAGQSVIVLTPEISLTAQLSQTFEAVFGAAVSVIHSQLTPAERRNIWVKIITQPGPHIVIGARSALFTPLNSVGLIVIDEAHESSYKQDQAPHYQAVRVAGKLASLSRATLVLGSATPSLVDYFVAEQKQAPILNMTSLAVPTKAKNRKPIIVDLKDRSAFSKNPYLSNILIASADKALKQNQQILLFLNRRGSARIVFCSNCGWQALCPNCDMPLTYHADDYKSRCHSCGFAQTFASSCPVCQNPDITLKGIGTKSVVEQITRIFPHAKVGRYDSDNTKNERFEKQYDKIRNGKIDILVGTQTLAKGLDLPKLSLVGVIMADSSLYSPDFTASERTYQLIRQVIGRVARGHNDGQAIIQTYNPNSRILRLASDKNWPDFYTSELAERQKFGFPPFYYLLKLSCRRKKAASAEQAASKLVLNLKSQQLRLEISQPMPAIREKVGGYYEWQIILKAKHRDELLKVIDILPSGWLYDIDPNGIL
ncbi:MAG: replication restart helicase PriA [Candidatus Saccharimonadales bacterium]